MGGIVGVDNIVNAFAGWETKGIKGHKSLWEWNVASREIFVLMAVSENRVPPMK